MPELTHEKQLRIISKAWGGRRGYVFFPWIPGDIKTKLERKGNWNEGPAFKWPAERNKILDHMRAHVNDDVYWCPSIFEGRRRIQEQAQEEQCLWADLDGIDPRTIEDYPPTIAWESSPGSYQALWLIQRGFDMLGASGPGGENQRMTYYLGADNSGWDTTQMMRIPGWLNHKPDRVEANGGTPPQGKLLWDNRRIYLPDEFGELPHLDRGATVLSSEVLEAEVEKVDRHKVYARVRLKLPKRAREIYASKSASGDRSENLWWLMRCLADAGCSVIEIVAIVRPTVWNKFADRTDELQPLSLEAAKAVSTHTDEDEAQEELTTDKLKFINLFDAIDNAPPMRWLVKDILSRGSCGFIAGQPKTYKSWFALDLALSVATGMPFLDYFPIRHQGKVAFIQEEDGPRRIKRRLAKLWPSKQTDKVQLDAEGHPEWVPAKEVTDKPAVDVLIGQGFVISEGGWQEWLDEQLQDAGYCLLILDPLMMIAGNVEENRAQDMTENVFKPLKQLAQKHDVAILLVHHLRKGDPKTPTRGGQLMLGSVANHAWSENSMYIQRVGKRLKIELENKDTLSGEFTVSGVFNKGWTPIVSDMKGDVDESPEEAVRHSPADPSANGTPITRQRARAFNALQEIGPGWHSTKKICEVMGVTRQSGHSQLKRLEEQGKVHFRQAAKGQSGFWSLNGEA